MGKLKSENNLVMDINDLDLNAQNILAVSLGPVCCIQYLYATLKYRYKNYKLDIIINKNIDFEDNVNIYNYSGVFDSQKILELEKIKSKKYKLAISVFQDIKAKEKFDEFLKNINAEYRGYLLYNYKTNQFELKERKLIIEKNE